MASFRRLFSKLRNFLNPSRAELELIREITSHLTLLEDDFRQRGMCPEDARLAARRAYGGIEQAKELHRQERSFLWLEQAWQDIQFSTRALIKNPGLTITLVSTLGLGIGTSAAIFSLIQNILLKPLPYRNPNQLVQMIENVPAAESLTGKAIRLPAMSYEEVAELRSSRTLAQIALYLPSPMVLTKPAAAQVVQVTQVTQQLLPMLGVQPLLGRTFSADEIKAGTNSVVLLSYGAWVKYFGTASNVLARSVILDGVRYSVIGVMPPSFYFPDVKTGFWKPLAPTIASTGQPAVFPVLARVNSNFSLLAVSAEVNEIFRQMRGGTQSTRSKSSGLQRIEVQTLKESLSAISRPALLVLAVSVGFVLLIACANVSNLLFGRTEIRQREIAIRASLGAGFSRLMRQCLTESVVLGCLGGLAGVPLTLAINRGLLLYWPGNINAADTMPRLDHLDFGIPGILFIFAVSILAGVLLGLPPALYIYRTDHMESLKRGAAYSFSGLRLHRGNRGLGTLVISETGLAFVLLIAAGLLIRSFLKLSSVDPGFNTNGVLTFQVASSPNSSRNAFNAELAERLRTLPGVQAAGYGELLPLERDSMLIRPLRVNSTALSSNRATAIQPRTLEGSWDYFRAVGMRLRRGRWFQEQDGPARHQVVLVNQAFSRYYFGEQNPLGKMLFSLGNTPWEIVGVVDDVRQQGLVSNPEPQFFLEYRQMQHANPRWGSGLDRLYSSHMYFAIRVAGEASDLVPKVRQIVRELDKTAVVSNISPLADVVSNTISAPEFYSVLVGTLSVVAVGLAAIGLYGVIAYAVNQRTREIGIRMVLGARRSQVLLLVLGQGARLASIGLLLGIAGSVVVTRYLESMLFGVSSLDLRTFAMVSGIFAIVVIVASWIPANRATKVDPVLSLRHE